MPALLAILASPRGDYSVSTALTHSFVEAFQAAHPSTTVVVRDLYKMDMPFVDLPWIAGAYTPPETHSEESKRALAISDKLIAELNAADHIVIGTPMYNFTTPAILKAWIDHIVRLNVTFNAQYEGLVKGKKATILIASGGVYSPGSQLASYNAESTYLKQILGFIGITDVTVLLAGGTSAIDRGNASREEILAQFTPEVQAAAKA